jgi:hypothetical protein
MAPSYNISRSHVQSKHLPLLVHAPPGRRFPPKIFAPILGPEEQGISCTAQNANILERRLAVGLALAMTLKAD